MKHVDLKNRVFGKLTVISRADKTSGGNYRWNCVCSCGKNAKVGGTNLQNGHTKSCGCLQPHLSSLNSTINNRKEGAAFRKLLRQYKSSAQERSIEWALSEEDFRVLVTSACFYTGRLPQSVSRAASGEIFVHNGIDRLDSSKGYSTENCVSCCTVVNYAKRSLSVEDFLQMVKEVFQCKRL